MAGKTQPLKQQLESLAKTLAAQPNALQLKEQFDLVYSEARSLVIYEEMRNRRVTSMTKLIKEATRK